MKKTRKVPLLYEEKRTTIWFLCLFYTIFLIYDISYNYILPELPWFAETVLLNSNYKLFYLPYIVIIGLLPISIILLKKDKPEMIKYIYFVSYTSINMFTDIVNYWGNEVAYSSGNVVEIMIVLFSPIFVNKKFFYIVSLGTILKFLILGLVIQEVVVFFPMLIVIVLAIIAYIFLNRVLGYVDAIKNSYDQQLEGIVKGVITSIELKDMYTRGHSERVALYAQTLAKATERFNDTELKSFYYACLLHDIGKVSIPDSILTKPGILTPEEYEIIKTHPVVGVKALQHVEGFTDNLDIIQHHHERWDGKGYPDGLKGEETPILSRITAIADAFDAMTSSRSYRSALSVEEAYQRILEGSGSQFDPYLVELFKDVYPKWIEIRNSYQHNEISSSRLKGGEL